jgi:hypothetical protein
VLFITVLVSTTLTLASLLTVYSLLAFILTFAAYTVLIGARPKRNSIKNVVAIILFIIMILHDKLAGLNRK